MTALQPEMEEMSQKGAEGPREVVWPFLFSLSVSAAPDLSGEAAHSLGCALEPAAFKTGFVTTYRASSLHADKKHPSNISSIPLKRLLILFYPVVQTHLMIGSKRWRVWETSQETAHTNMHAAYISILLLSQRLCSGSTSPQQHELRPCCADSAIYSNLTRVVKTSAFLKAMMQFQLVLYSVCYAKHIRALRKKRDKIKRHVYQTAT